MASAVRHEGGERHQTNLSFYRYEAAHRPATPPTVSNPAAREAVRGPLWELLHDLGDTDVLADDQASQPPQGDRGLDWDALPDDFDGNLAPSHDSATVSALVSSLQDWMVEDDEDAESDEELAERSDESESGAQGTQAEAEGEFSDFETRGPR